MDSYSNSYCLLCPGPVNVRPEVARALTEYDFCHREEEFSVLLQQTVENALDVACLNRELYAAVIVTGSGTAGNEAVLASVLQPDERALVLASGEFGGRLGELCKLYNPNTEVLNFGWGESFDLDLIEEKLHQGSFDLLAMVHHETSTGLLNPVEAIGAICEATDTKLFVDAVSSYSADRCDWEKAKVTFMTTSAGKAIGAYPGLAIVFGRKSAFEDLKDIPVKNHYLNLYRHYDFYERLQQTPNTPAVPLLMALNRALTLALDEGHEGRLKRMAGLADTVRKHLRARGLRESFRDHERSVVLTTVDLPQGVSFDEMRRGLRELGFVIYGGKGPLKDKTFQVSTISDVGEAQIEAFFVALDTVLNNIQR